jgi:hypothetical protein
MLGYRVEVERCRSGGGPVDLVGAHPLCGEMMHGGEAALGNARRPDSAGGWRKEVGSGDTNVGFSGGVRLRSLRPVAAHGVAEVAWQVGWQPGRPPIWPWLLPFLHLPPQVVVPGQLDGG